MKKSITILFGALAALLLSVPVQAQTFTRSVAGQQTKVFAQPKKDLKSAVGVAQAPTRQTQTIVTNSSMKDTPRRLHQQQGETTGMRLSTLFAQKAPTAAKAPRQAATATEQRNEVGIIVAPAAGEQKLFTRSGMSYYPQNSQVYSEEQEGSIIMVECEDGTVYVQNFLFEYSNDTWVKGTRQGNTITIPAGQPIDYDTDYQITLSVNWCSYTAGVGFDKLTDPSFVFTDNDGVLTLEGSEAYKFIGLFYDTYDVFTGYGDFGTVFTQDKSYKPASTELVQIPAGLQTEEWYAVGSTSKSAFNTKFTVGFDGNDVYVKGLYDLSPEAWIKGTITDGTAIFPKCQFLGIAYDTYNIWAAGIDENDDIGDFIMSYDAESQTLMAENDLYFTAHDYEIFYYDFIKDLLLLKSNPASPITTLPYTNSFDTALENAAFTIIDSNDDNNTWGFSNGLAGYVYSRTQNADDWLITPAIQLEAGKAYHFSIDASAASKNYPEALEVKLGKAATAEAMTQEVVPATTINWTLFQPLENDIIVEESGLYYFGLHAISEADMYELTIDNLMIETAVKPTSARAPRLIVEADPYGAPKAVVTIATSELSMNGSKLDLIPTLELRRDGKVVKTYNDVTPGEVKVLVDRVDTPESITEGIHTYQAIPYDELGEVGQKSEKKTVFIGHDVPEAPAIENVVTQPGGVLVSWKPVTEGESGGMVNANEIEYAVCTTTTEIEYLFGIFPIEVTVPDEVLVKTKGTSAFIEMETEEGEQNYDTLLAVVAVNAEGESECAEFTPCLGKAYELPLEEHFLNSLNYNWLADGTYYTEAYFPDEEDVLPGTLIIEGEEDNEHYQLSLGKVAVTGTNPTLCFDLMSMGNKGNLVKVQAITTDGKCTTLASTTPSPMPRTIKVPLVDYVDDPYIKLVFDFQFNKADVIRFGNVMAFDMLENNVRVILNAPKNAKCGESVAIGATVQNMGRETVSNCILKLYAGEELIDETVIDEPLPTMEQYSTIVTYEPSIFIKADELELKAVVELDDDENPDDNTATAVMALIKSSAAQPQNVKAERQADGVKITWDAPDVSGKEVTESFEDTSIFPLWSIGGITETEKSGAFGPWTLYDADGSRVYGWSAIDQNKYAQQAWQVISVPGTLDAASGNQMLLSICPTSGNADDWLISPELTGDAQTIKFMASQLSTVDESSENFYGYETFEVLVSTTDKNISSFTKIADGKITKDEWTEFSYQLEAGVKYFAIRHTSNDIFGLLVDDITYTAAGGDISGYNIYVDGVDDVYDTVTETQAVVKNQPDAKWVAVSAVYASGEESQPVLVSLDGANHAATAIGQITRNHQPVDVYTVDGRLVRQQATDLNGLKGTFVIEGRKVMVK